MWQICVVFSLLEKSLWSKCITTGQNVKQGMKMLCCDRKWTKIGAKLICKYEFEGGNK